MTRAEARRRYGEIVPARDRVGPPLPLTVKNVAAVAADAALKTIVGMATIGNFADKPRGNLHEIGTGFGVLRTAAGDAIGVDVDNPRFGVASDMFSLAFAVSAKPRGGHAKIHGDTVTVYRVEGVPNARIITDSAGRVHILEGHKMLHLNFGQQARFMEYMQQKIRGGLDEPHVKSFEVPRSFLDELRATAVSQEKSGEFPGRPQIDDPSKALDQYGLRPAQIRELERAIVPGSGKVDGAGGGGGQWRLGAAYHTKARWVRAELETCPVEEA